MVRTRLAISVVLVSTFLLLYAEAKSVDPYKVLGVSRDAKQREIQKAFHKLSLKYHPDKNKNKGAQEKFAEINNAYEILSDEEKRKNYDLYGDEKRQPGFDSGFPGGNGGYSYSSNGGHGGGFSFGGPGGWQNMGGGGGSKSYSFSFGGGGPSESSFGFGMDDIFSMFSGGGSKGRDHFGGFGSSSKGESGSKSSKAATIKTINSQVYKKEIIDQGMTWLVLSYLPSQRGTQYPESIIEEVAESLQGALKVGRINCETESSLCKQLDIVPRKAPRLFVYSYTSSGKATLAEYTEELVVKKVKSFCQEHLPRFSKWIDLNTFDVSAAVSSQRTPKVMLLSTKKDTPVIWRVLSGLYNGRFVFYSTEVHDTSDPKIRKLGVDAFPAIVGWLSNGEKQVLKTGISVKNMKSAVHELGKLLEGFEKKNKVSSNSQPGQAPSESPERIPLLSRPNFDSICGENCNIRDPVRRVYRPMQGGASIDTVGSGVYRPMQGVASIDARARGLRNVKLLGRNRVGSTGKP